MRTQQPLHSSACLLTEAKRLPREAFEPKPKLKNQNVYRGSRQRRVRALAHYKGKTRAGRHETPKGRGEFFPAPTLEKWGETKTKTGRSTSIRTQVW